VTGLPRQLSWLRNATLPDGRTVDVRIDGPLVTEIQPAASSRLSGVHHSGPHKPSGQPAAGPTTPGPTGRRPTDDVDEFATLDLTGFVLLTAPAEPHAHLDKAFSWDLIQPPSGNLELAIASWRAYAATMTSESVLVRARQAALALLRNGVTAVRSHVDLLAGDQPLRGVEALVRLREELIGLMDVELAVMVPHDAAEADAEAALDLGVDLVGGAPHLSADPPTHLRRLLALAERRDVGVDLHIDENLDRPLTLTDYARSVRHRPAGTSLSAGHCVRLGTLPTADLSDAVDELLASDLGIISLPLTNLYLQGWQHPVSTPRGLTAVRTLIDRGARFAAGGDNVRDPFNPVGRSDPLETAALLVAAGHLSAEEAYTAVSEGARSVLRLPPAGAEAGARAEFLAVRAGSLADVVASASPDRFVVHNGFLVSQSEIHYQTAALALTDRPGALHD
jgi:cytosine deaminase